MISFVLSSQLRTQDDWVIVDTPKLELAGQQLTPALAGWRRENATRSAPDWICVIPTAGDSPTRARKELTVYQTAGTKHMWLFDPLSRQLEVYRVDGQWKLIRTVGTNDSDAALPPFERLTLDLKSLWSG